jgi:MoaA/NifB/PqqE/SkfB family radical SAM enzyme
MTEIAQIVDSRLKPFSLHVTTNGFLTDRIVEFCEKRPRRAPLDLLISMDGVGDKHNEVRGHSRAYDLCLQTIQALAPRRKELRMRIAVNQTIVDAEGARHYSKLREVLRPYGIRNQIVMAYDVSATYNLEHDVDVAPREAGQFSTFGTFTNDEIRELLDEVEGDLDQYSWGQRLAKRYYLRGIRNRLLNHEGTPNPKCVALTSHMRIFPNGDVPTCQFNSHTIGNLREQSFKEVWQSVKADAQRRWVNRCAGCWAECEVLPSAIYTGDLLASAR